MNEYRFQKIVIKWTNTFNSFDTFKKARRNLPHRLVFQMSLTIFCTGEYLVIDEYSFFNRLCFPIKGHLQNLLMSRPCGIAPIVTCQDHSHTKFD